MKKDIESENEILIDIIKFCLFVEIKASQIYRKLSELSKNQELKAFWADMFKDENMHIKFWRNLFKLVKQGIVPQIFENIEEVKTDLAKSCRKIADLYDIFSKNKGDISNSDAFMLAYRTEFYLMHPAFETLFHFVKPFVSKETPENSYSNHIDRFIDGLNKYGSKTPELEILGETLKRLWNENRMLTKQSSTDHLTNILNRKTFFNVLGPLSHLAKRNKSGVAFLMIDIDDFKNINDTLGHKKGDDVLKNVAEILKNNIRSSDILGRYGGEEFILYLSPTNKDSAYKIAEKIRKKVELESKSNLELPVTVSIGLSYGNVSQNVDEETAELINKADSCLYKAKKTGKNKVYAIDSLQAK